MRLGTVLVLFPLLAGCDGDDDTAGSPSAPIDVPETDGCEDLNPRFCAFPWPSDRFLAEDPSTATGYRLAYTPEILPEAAQAFDFTPFARLDGVSPATQIMTMFDAPADLSSAASWDDIGRSLHWDSPTVIVDLETGARIAHWTENDARAQSPEETVLYLRLAGRLEEDRAYGVALRGLAGEDGVPFEPDPAFAALRDGTPTTSDRLEARRPSYERLFDGLEAAGVPRADLQQAWWFHTASGDAIRGDLLAAREDALERLGPDGIGCTVTSVEDGYGGDGLTLRRVRGTYTVPWYMDGLEAPSRFVRGDDGRPVWQQDAEIGFTAIVSASLVQDGTVRPGPVITFGHGLMGDAEDTLSWGSVREMAYLADGVFVGTDWAGMCADDATGVAAALYDMSQFDAMAERLQQGMINQIALTRTIAGACAAQDAFQWDGAPLLDTDRRYYVGASQGGIYGGTLLTLSPDIDRGVLLVNGAVFPVMIERSIDYVPYLPLFESAYPRRLDQALLLPLAQHLWDAAEPSGWLAHLAEGIEGIGPKQVLAVAAENDAQVPNLSTDQAMRMVGAPVIQGSTREPWGFEVVDAPWEGSGWITIDWGDPRVPEGNVAPETDEGGHWYVPLSDVTVEMSTTFLETGVIPMPCDGRCDPD